MTDRGLPSVDGPPACPFIAFEDERDERASSPDHRHRCYAEVQPAPRALAHQEAYCLSSAFPVCPTFQDWARREAAQARGSSVRGSSGASATAASVAAQMAARPSAEVRPEEDDLGLAVDDPDHDDAPDGAPDDRAAEVDDDDRDDADEWSQPRPDAEPPIRRNPPRDWAAPPPWASGSSGAGSYGRPTAEGDPSAPEFLASRPAAAAAGAGLAGSAADRLASGQPVGTHASSPPSDELAGLVAEPAARSAPPARPPDRPPTGHYPTTAAAGRRPTVSSTRPKTPPDHDGPSWEAAKRYEAYPTIKTRAGLPGVPRLAAFAAALIVGAFIVFMLPGFLGVGGAGPTSSARPTPGSSEVVASDSPEPTVIAAPTQQTYTIKAGDTLNKIAKKFGLTVDQLLAANKQIKNPNKIAKGDVLTIPTATQDVVTDPSAEAPSASPNP